MQPIISFAHRQLTMTSCTKDENVTQKKTKEPKNQVNIYVYFNKRQEVFPDPSPQSDKKCDAKPIASLRKETNQKANLGLDLKEHLLTL